MSSPTPPFVFGGVAGRGFGYGAPGLSSRWCCQRSSRCSHPLVSKPRVRCSCLGCRGGSWLQRFRGSCSSSDRGLTRARPTETIRDRSRGRSAHAASADRRDSAPRRRTFVDACARPSPTAAGPASSSAGSPARAPRVTAVAVPAVVVVASHMSAHLLLAKPGPSDCRFGLHGAVRTICLRSLLSRNRGHLCQGRLRIDPVAPVEN